MPLYLQASSEAATRVGTLLPGNRALLYEGVRFAGDCLAPIKTFLWQRYNIDLDMLGKSITPRQLGVDTLIMERMKDLKFHQLDKEHLPEIYSIAVWDSPRGGHLGVVADYDLERITIVESDLRGDGRGSVRRIDRRSPEWKKNLLALWESSLTPGPNKPRQAPHLMTECRVRAAGLGELAPAIKGEIAGTIEEKRGLEGFWLDAEVPLRYRIRAGAKWSPEVPNRTWLGTSGESITGIGVRLLRSDLTVELAAHFAGLGWIGPFCNGSEATKGARTIEAVNVFIYKPHGS